MKEIFDNYLKKFDKRNSKIKGRILHSYRVMELCEILAKELKLSEREIYLARILGLFHDIGRFKQIVEYDNFDDLNSFDHGDMSYNIFLRDIVPNLDLTMEEVKIIGRAIKYHNKYQIGKVSEKESVFCKLVRDAEKLDKLYLMSDVEDIKNIKDEVSECNNKDFMNHKMIKHTNIGTDADEIISKLSLIWDINYYYSYLIIKDYKYFKIYKARLGQDMFEAYFDEIDKFLGGI